jgi:hypothetical protein
MAQIEKKREKETRSLAPLAARYGVEPNGARYGKDV